MNDPSVAEALGVWTQVRQSLLEVGQARATAMQNPDRLSQALAKAAVMFGHSTHDDAELLMGSLDNPQFVWSMLVSTVEQLLLTTLVAVSSRPVVGN